MSALRKIAHLWKGPAPVKNVTKVSKFTRAISLQRHPSPEPSIVRRKPQLHIVKWSHIYKPGQAAPCDFRKGSIAYDFAEIRTTLEDLNTCIQDFGDNIIDHFSESLDKYNREISDSLDRSQRRQERLMKFLLVTVWSVAIAVHVLILQDLLLEARKEQLE